MVPITTYPEALLLSDCLFVTETNIEDRIVKISITACWRVATLISTVASDASI